MTDYKVEWLKWETNIESNNFNIFVVEPQKLTFDDDLDSILFKSIINSFFKKFNIFPEITPQDEINFIIKPNLIVFPEIFLPDNVFVDFLQKINIKAEIGCIHTGLRPGNEKDEIDFNYNSEFLFSEDRVENLLCKLHSLNNVNKTDILKFEDWFKNVYKKENEGKPLNLACFISKEINNNIRICIHPKIVRSKFEYGFTDKETTFESNIIFLISLLPKDKRYLPVHILPLICSDVLMESNDKSLDNPLQGLIKCCDNFVESIDIVSVVTCTPVSKRNSKTNYGKYTWHPKYKDVFFKASSGDMYNRYQNSCFVMSNYNKIPGLTQGGLSGIFIPKNFDMFEYLKNINLTMLHIENYSRPLDSMRTSILKDEFGNTGESEIWLSLRFLAEKIIKKEKDETKILAKYEQAVRRGLGVLISIDYFDDDFNKIIVFKLEKTPRRINIWGSPPKLSKPDIYSIRFENKRYKWKQIY